MEVLYRSKFARQFKKLPRDVQDAAIERERWFRINPNDPRLHIHKLRGMLEGFWALSITNRHRIMFEFIDDHTAWFHEIGTHNIYDA